MKFPGFIDLQVNGHKGVDFSSPDLTEEKIVYACQELFKTGTAAFLPTLITSSEQNYEKNLPLIASVISRDEFKGKLLGIHLEGPFISSQPGAVGAHKIDCVRKPSVEYLKKLQKLACGNIKLITIAAEADGADKLAKYAVKNGITVSLGHQTAQERELEKLVKAGASSLTHLGNALLNQIDRHRNPLWAGLANEDLTAMIITDSHHLPDTLIKTIIKTKGVSKTVVTSDASFLAGMPVGEYECWGEKVVLEESGYLHMPERKCMAGSSATMLECMNYLASLNLLDEKELFMVGFYNPLKLINVDAKFIRNGKGIKFDQDTNKFEVV